MHAEKPIKMLIRFYTRLFFICFLLLLDLQVRGQTLDSLQLALAGQRQDTGMVRLIQQIGDHYYNIDQLDSAKNYFLQAVNLAESLNDETGLLDGWKRLGDTDSRGSSIDSSIMWYNRGFELIDRIEPPITWKIDYLINRGVSYYFAGNIGEALVDYIEANDLCRLHKKNKSRSMILNNLGIFYRALERYDEAQQIYRETYTFREKEQDTLGMANVLLNMSTASNYSGKYEEALVTIHQARVLFKQIGYEKGDVETQLNIGSIYLKMGDYDRALESLAPLSNFNDLHVANELKMQVGLDLAWIYLQKERFEESSNSVQRVEPLIEAANHSASRIELLSIKHRLQDRKGNSQAAYRHVVELLALKDERTDNQNAKLLKEQETKYLTKEKEQKIKLLNIENSLAESRLRASRQRTTAMLFGILLLASILFVLKRLYDRLRKQNDLIQKADKEKEVLLREIHHRVKNNLQVISSLLSLQSRHMQDEGAANALRSGHDRVKSMSLIHKDLYQHDNLKGVDTKDYLEKLIGNLFHSYNISSGKINLVTDIQPLLLDVDTMVPLGLLINELISNSLKHGFPDGRNGTLQIQLKEINQVLHLEIKDDGVGTIVGNETSNDSFGRSLIETFSEQLGTKPNYLDGPGFGVELQIRNYAYAV